MQKLVRFIIVSLLFVATLILFYSIIPFIVWVFGGSFKEVSQSVPYVVFCMFLMLPTLGVIFSECFDSKFYPKR
jgi:hypothetical protein